MSARPIFPMMFGLGLLVAAPGAWAGSATYLSPEASRCDMFRALSRTVPATCRLGRPRGLVFHDAKAQPAVDAEPERDLAIALRIEFAFDSSELTAGARQSLDKLAAVLADDLMRDTPIGIEGHADARGSATYNLTLSERRAWAVRRYLVDVHKIDDARLWTTGKGESEPYDPADPNAGLNRRVEFRNLGG